MSSESVRVSEEKSKFYQAHLERVSRSFAVCIEQLPEPGRQWVGLSYILCRLVDTVEDSNWSLTDNQIQSFEDFLEFVQVKPSTKGVVDWVKQLPEDIPEGEKKLLEDAPVFFEDLHSLPEPVFDHIQRCVSDMTKGMLYFSQNSRRDGRLILRTVEETNQYCFFVAGIVGEMLTYVMSNLIPNWNDTEDLLEEAYHFGFYLQKVNLLKDHLVDAAEGRHFIPDYLAVRESLQIHASAGLNYLTSIPKEARGYRLFCAWSIFLGLASLKWIDKSWESQTFKKIPRTKALQVFRRVKSLVDSNEALEKEFHHYMKKIDKREASEISSLDTHLWFEPLYSGQLPVTSMARLGMIPRESYENHSSSSK